MEGNRLDISLANADAFKDILVNESNDDVIIPISATFDKAVLHVEIGGKRSVSIEKPVSKKRKELATSVENATKEFLQKHFIIDNYKTPRGKDKRRKSGKRKQSGAQGGRIQKRQELINKEQLPFLLFKCDTNGPTKAIEVSCKTDIAKPKILAINIPPDQTATKPVKTDDNKQPVLSDPDEKIRLQEIMAASNEHESYSLDEDVSTRPSACVKTPDYAIKTPDYVKRPDYAIKSPDYAIRTPDHVKTPDYIKTPDCAFKKLFHTQFLAKAASPAGARYTRSLMDVAKKFSQSGLLRETVPHTAPPFITKLSNAMQMLSEPGHLSQTNSQNSSDDTNPAEESARLPECVLADKDGRSNALAETVAPENMVGRLPEDRAFYHCLSLCVGADMVPTRKKENKLPEKFPAKAASFRDLFDTRSYKDSMEFIEEEMEESRSLGQYVPQQVIDNVTTHKREITIPTETQPSDQVVSILSHTGNTDFQELVASYSTGPRDEINTAKQVLNEVSCNRLDVMLNDSASEKSLDRESRVASNDLSLVTAVKDKTITDVVVNISEHAHCNEFDIASNITAVNVTTSAEELPGEKSDFLATGETPPRENIAVPSQQYGHADTNVISVNEIAISSSETVPCDQFGATSVDFSTQLEHIASPSESAHCNQFRVTTEATSPVDSNSRESEVGDIHESTSLHVAAGTVAPVDVSLSDIVTILPADDADEGNQDSDDFGIMRIYLKSEIHSDLNNVSKISPKFEKNEVLMIIIVNRSRPRHTVLGRNYPRCPDCITRKNVIIVGHCSAIM